MDPPLRNAGLVTAMPDRAGGREREDPQAAGVAAAIPHEATSAATARAVRRDGTSGAMASIMWHSAHASRAGPLRLQGVGGEHREDGFAMAWDFSTEPEFESRLEWMRAFVRDEIFPLETLELDNSTFLRVVRPLQEQVKEKGLWASHLPPEMGGGGFGQV